MQLRRLFLQKKITAKTALLISFFANQEPSKNLASCIDTFFDECHLEPNHGEIFRGQSGSPECISLAGSCALLLAGTQANISLFEFPKRFSPSIVEFCQNTLYCLLCAVSFFAFFGKNSFESAARKVMSFFFVYIFLFRDAFFLNFSVQTALHLFLRFSDQMLWFLAGFRSTAFYSVILCHPDAFFVQFVARFSGKQQGIGRECSICWRRRPKQLLKMKNG